MSDKLDPASCAHTHTHPHSCDDCGGLWCFVCRTHHHFEDERWASFRWAPCIENVRGARDAALARLAVVERERDGERDACLADIKECRQRRSMDRFLDPRVSSSPYAHDRGYLFGLDALEERLLARWNDRALTPSAEKGLGDDER